MSKVLGAFPLRKYYTDEEWDAIKKIYRLRENATQERRLDGLKGDKNDAIRYVTNLDRLGLLKRISIELNGLSSDEIPFNLSQLIANAFNDGMFYSRSNQIT